MNMHKGWNGAEEGNEISRRGFLKTSAFAVGGLALGHKVVAGETIRPSAKKGLIAITLDLEMARNFPAWENEHWDYEKGNLNRKTKQYAVEAGRRVKAHGGVIHYFLVARALEQENVDWLKEILAMGHRIGNHTYDHVFVRAKTLDEVQFLFKRAPWLVEGKKPLDVIRENVRMANAAIKMRLGTEAAGFRTPGGFTDGLSQNPEIQRMFLDLGFKWISCKYPSHPYGKPGQTPTADVFEGIVKAQQEAQPLVYPSGLIDIPMSPISDVGAFRNGRWSLEDFLKAVRLGVEWAIENKAVYDFLAHPAVLYAKDPEFRSIEMICDLVKKAGNRAAIVNLDTIAAQIR